MKRFILRFLWFAFLFVVILTAIQDLVIFPGIVSSAVDRFTGGAATEPSRVQSLFVETSDRNEVHMWRLAPENPATNHVAVIFHGNGGSLDMFFMLQRWFESFGMTSYNFDYRGYGRSKGWPSENGIYLDAQSVVQYVLEHESIEPSELVIFGLSVGAGPAAKIARDVSPAALLLLSPYTSLPAVAEDRFVYRHLSGLMWYEFPTKRFLEQLENTCVIIAHGMKDTIIYPHHSKKLVASLEGRVPIHSIFHPTAKHNDLFYRTAPQLEKRLWTCLGKSENPSDSIESKGKNK